MQSPLQLTSVAAQIVEQLPAEQTCPDGQACPHAPQLALSLVVLAQYVAPASAPQVVRAVAHVVAQLPCEQT
jgi:hypothetical protein